VIDFGIAIAVTAHGVGVAFGVVVLHAQHEVDRKLTRLFRQVVAHDGRTIGDQAGLPDNVQIVHVQQAVIHHAAQVATGETIGLFAHHRGPSHGGIILALQHGDDALLMPATKAGGREIFLVIDPGAGQFGARNKVARGRVRVGIGQRTAFQILQRGQAAIGAGHGHCVIAKAVIDILGGQHGRHGIVVLQVDTGIARCTHPGLMQLASQQALHNTGIVRGREQFDRHAQRVAQQVGKAIVAAVGFVFAAQQAHIIGAEISAPISGGRGDRGKQNGQRGSEA